MRIENFSRYVKRTFESINQNEIDSDLMDKCCKGKWEVVDDLINIDGDFIASAELKERTTLLPLRFGKVTGDFDVSDNELKDLEGCPSHVGGSFNCSSNRIESLKGGPTSAKKYLCANNFIHSIEDIAKDSEEYVLSGNNIESLPKLPQEIKGSLYLHETLISSLDGCPKRVGGNFDVSDCKNLKSLDGGPEYVGKNFLCSGSNLESLQGSPKEVGGFFEADSNDLSSLEGMTQKIGKWISLSKNKLVSVDHLGSSNAKKTVMLDKNSSSPTLFKMQLSYLADHPGEDKGNEWVMDILKRNTSQFIEALGKVRSENYEKLMDYINLQEISKTDNKLLAGLITLANRDKTLKNYIDNNIDQFSKDFREDYEVSSDLSDLGF